MRGWCATPPRAGGSTGAPPRSGRSARCRGSRLGTPSTTTVTAPSEEPGSPRGGTLRSGGGNSQGCAERNANRSMAATAPRASRLWRSGVFLARPKDSNRKLSFCSVGDSESYHFDERFGRGDRGRPTGLHPRAIAWTCFGATSRVVRAPRRPHARDGLDLRPRRGRPGSRVRVR